MIKNTRAEIPVVILVLGVLLVCVLALVNFHFFSIKGNYKHLEKVSVTESCLSYIEQYDFYENLGYSIEQIKSLETFKDKIGADNKLICDSEGIRIRYPLS